ncbi:MAG: lysophospholipid acyltransferase family protein [Chloroflexi bacterium]|nr:lysophospholipid acyltransferase family protein [Chloroflexota bacterium]
MLRPLWYNLLHLVVAILRWPLMLTFITHGREKLPARGPYLVVTNHTGIMDSPMIFTAVPTYDWGLLAGEKWGKNPLTSWLLGLSGAIFIKRGEVDRQALKEAEAALQRGCIFGLAPEGTRSKTGQMIQARDGAAFLAVRANVPIVPVGIIRSDQWAANWKRGRWTRIEAFIGEPFMLPDLGRRPKGKEFGAFTELIMAHIAAELPPQYHGFYADSPALAALQQGEDPWQALVNEQLAMSNEQKGMGEPAHHE